LRRISSVALEAVVAVILPAVVGLVVIGDELLPFLYGGEGFSESVTVLRIVAWVALASAITTILGQTLWAAGRELVALRIDVVNAVVMITASLTFISLWGVPGAAIAALVVALLNVVQQYLPVAGLLDGFPMGRMLWRPVLAAVAMTAVLLAADDYHLVTRVILGSGAYVLAIAALTLSTGGGWAGVKSRWDLEDATNP
jgi:O-antigen/teichoic acid export membrane protein